MNIITKKIIIAGILALSSSKAFASQTDVVSDQLQLINGVAIEHGYTIKYAGKFNDMKTNAGAIWNVPSSPRSLTTIHIVCDDYCKYLDADLYNDKGDMIVSTENMKDEERPDIRVLSIKNTSNEPIDITLTVKMRSCANSTCVYGMSLAEKPL